MERQVHVGYVSGSPDDIDDVGDAFFSYDSANADDFKRITFYVQGAWCEQCRWVEYGAVEWPVEVRHQRLDET